VDLLDLADQLAALLNLVVPPALEDLVVLEALETSMELHLLVDLQG
jgi:hypothetical protein